MDIDSKERLIKELVRGNYKINRTNDLSINNVGYEYKDVINIISEYVSLIEKRIDAINKKLGLTLKISNIKVDDDEIIRLQNRYDLLVLQHQTEIQELKELYKEHYRMELNKMNDYYEDLRMKEKEKFEKEIEELKEDKNEKNEENYYILKDLIFTMKDVINRYEVE